MHKALFFLSLILLLFPLFSCERAEKAESRTIVFEVQSTESQAVSGEYSSDGTVYRLNCPGEAFLPSSAWQAEDLIYRPTYLQVSINLLGELIPSLENPNGYQVQTQFELEGGTIRVEHTNQASPVITTSGDTLYAVRGEGIISSGFGSFESISGFFHEESTYRIAVPSEGVQRPQVWQINCRYELVVDF